MITLAQIDQELISAMKDGNDLLRDTLRLLKSSLKNLQIEKGTELTEEDILKVILKEVKKRQESITLYKQANRQELADQEQLEMDILQKYLPEMVSDDEVKQMVDEYFAANPDLKNEPKGKVIGQLVGEFKGKAEPSQIAQYVSTIIS